MSEAVAIQPGYAQVRVREPAGERTFGETLSIGAEGSDVVVPGSAANALLIERHDAQWHASSRSSANVRINGRPLVASRELRRHDVLTVGEAQVEVADASRTLLRIDVRHLVGNETIAPMTEVAALAGDLDDDDLEIRVSSPLQLTQPTILPAPDVPASSHREMPPPAQPAALKWAIGIAIAVALLSLLWVFSSLESIKLDVRPADARIRMPGTWISLRVDQQMRVLPGTHVVRAEREGYVTREVSVDVQGGAEPTARIRLAKLPGRLNIDTHGIAAKVSVDGREAGDAPGEVQVPAGQRTITLRAPKYLDFVKQLDIEGADVEQDLNATLQPAWGTVKVSASPASARVSIDDQDVGPVPVSSEVSSGVRKVQIAAPGFKAWQSSVVVKAGETVSVGPVTLGQPDARASIRSTPTGAEVTVDGSFRGRTPLVVELPSGVTHEIVATFRGHETWTRKVLAEPAKNIELDARLTPVLGAVTFTGEPAGAEVLVDGALRGQTPFSVNLTAEEHRIQIRKAEYLPFDTTITPAKGLDRSFEYKLTPADRGAALLASAPTVKTKDGYVLKLIPVGTFLMGSDRREQGRRPNEPQRKVTLKRPFYIGVNEVTNEDFRRFRPGHASGYIGSLSLDLDKQAVSLVSWNDAAEYCNWLSEREGLPAAYEKRGEGKYFLKTPVTIGYRLPTEAEWEYAARRTPAGKTVRFPWGDALPVAPDTGNLAGSEAGKIVEGELPGYQDNYVVVAPVGKFTPNALGLHDLGGNVSEWANDFYLSFVDTRDSVDPLGPEQAGKHVIRGANWRSSAVSELRLAWRDSGEEPSPTIGFRIARYAE